MSPARTTRGDIQPVVISGYEGEGGVTTPTEYNVPLIAANTEYSRTLPRGCRAVAFRCRTSAAIRYAWQTGRVAGSVAPYQTLAAGSEYFKENITLPDARRTIYFASTAGGVMVEIEAWS